MSTILLKPGDQVRLKNNVGSAFYDRQEIYVSGTKGSIARIVTAEEFLSRNGYAFYNHAEIEKGVKNGVRYPVQYEKVMPLSVGEPMGFEIIDHCREGGYDLIYIGDLEKAE